MAEEQKTDSAGPESPGPPKGDSRAGLFISLLVSAFILLGYSLVAFLMWKVTARIGLALLTTVLIMSFSRDSKKALAPLAILWIAVALTFVF